MRHGACRRAARSHRGPPRPPSPTPRARAHLRRPAPEGRRKPRRHPRERERSQRQQPRAGRPHEPRPRSRTPTARPRPRRAAEREPPGMRRPDVRSEGCRRTSSAIRCADPASSASAPSSESDHGNEQRTLITAATIASAAPASASRTAPANAAETTNTIATSASSKIAGGHTEPAIAAKHPEAEHGVHRTRASRGPVDGSSEADTSRAPTRGTRTAPARTSPADRARPWRSRHGRPGSVTYAVAVTTLGNDESVSVAGEPERTPHAERHRTDDDDRPGQAFVPDRQTVDNPAIIAKAGVAGVCGLRPSCSATAT